MRYEDIETPKLGSILVELMSKEALNPRLLSSLKGKAHLLGGAGGAAVGAGGGAIAGGEGNRLQGALLGGAAGAAVGAGGGALLRTSKPRAGFRAPSAGAVAPPAGGVRPAAPTMKSPARNTQFPGTARSPGAGRRPPPPPAVSQGSPAVSQAAPSPSTVVDAPIGTASTQRAAAPNHSRNPTLESAEHAKSVYKNIPTNVRTGLENTTLVRSGVPPEMAMQLALLSKSRGESAMGAVQRHAGLGKSAQAKLAGYLLNQVGKSKIRQLGAAAPNAKHRAKQASTKLAFSESEYSGGLGEGRFEHYAGFVPPFRKPSFKLAGPDIEEAARVQSDLNKQASVGPMSEMGAMLDELCKLNAVQSPESQITKSQQVGAPRSTTPSGPSIAQVSKPVGFGRPQAGAIKSAAA